MTTRKYGEDVPSGVGMPGANPVQARVGLGRWLKSQLPGGEKGRNIRELPVAVKRTLTSPAMVGRALRAFPPTAGPLGAYDAGKRAVGIVRDPRRALGWLPPVRAARTAQWGIEQALAAAKSVAPYAERALGKSTTGAAGELVRQARNVKEDVEGFAANPVKAVSALLKGKEEEVAAAPAPGVPSAWYPDSGMSWAGEPGGKYLSARYPREFGTWGVGTPGEGWAHIAERGGWDKHIHPIYSEGALGAILSKPYRARSSSRAYQRY